VFYIDVANIDRDVAHFAMAIHVCFKHMFQMFHMFQTYVTSVSSECCKSRSECRKNRSGCRIYMQVFQVF
jgi:hypothetical protein